MAQRLAVRKTPKLFIGGAFVRSESGRTYACELGGRVVHVARATRKDARDAVWSARSAWPAWRDRWAYNRGQIIYRLAEVMESRREQFASTLQEAGQTVVATQREVSAAIDRIVWYAGWCDKIEQVLSTKNPVATPHFNVSSPEPTGVVAVIAPRTPSLLSLVSTTIPIVCSGNTIVAAASESDPLSAVNYAEALATSDFPTGVINVLTGVRAEIVPTLAAHMDVNAIDLWIADEKLAAGAAQLATDNLKRVRRHDEPSRQFWFGERAQGLEWIEPFIEIKTVWHPAGV
jgi:acyl-CoA reductase-like NAD-dependent aldehyde dehydrogenase